MIFVTLGSVAHYSLSWLTLSLLSHALSQASRVVAELWLQFQWLLERNLFEASPQWRLMASHTLAAYPPLSTRQGNPSTTMHSESHQQVDSCEPSCKLRNLLQQFRTYLDQMSPHHVMDKCKKYVTPVHKQWSYIFLALTHLCVVSYTMNASWIPVKDGYLLYCEWWTWHLVQLTKKISNYK